MQAYTPTTYLYFPQICQMQGREEMLGKGSKHFTSQLYALTATATIAPKQKLRRDQVTD